MNETQETLPVEESFATEPVRAEAPVSQSPAGVPTYAARQAAAYPQPPLYSPAPRPKSSKGWIFSLVALIVSIATFSVSIANFFPEIGQEKAEAPDFQMKNFHIDTEKTGYDWVRYSGEGTITVSDKTHIYMAVVEKTLVSGGAADTEKVSYSSSLIVNGEGHFYTYDSGTVDEIDQPLYTFKLIGYQLYETDLPRIETASDGDRL